MRSVSNALAVIGTLLVIFVIEVHGSGSSPKEVRQHLSKQAAVVGGHNAVLGDKKKVVKTDIGDLLKEISAKSDALNLNSITNNKHLKLPTCTGGRSDRYQSGNCSYCKNGEDCCDGASCCGGGDFCCGKTATCCNDTCCGGGYGRNAEDCCPDPINGGVCCQKETTMCCAPRPSRDLPSRCCPRWYVCCDHGRYGCCDPDTMTPMEENSAYALFLEPSWFGPMLFEAATVDLTSGSMTQVNVPDFHTGGEDTRTFMFDRNNGTFLLLQANFTEKPAPGGNPKWEIHLYNINPITGNVSKTKVTGAVDEVTGYHYVEQLGKIVMSTYSYNSSGHKVGFDYYHVDVATAVATKISTSFSANSTVDAYAGWFHDTDEDGKKVYRLGYGNVKHSLGFGVETTDLSTNPATVTFTLVPAPENYTHFKTLNKLASASSSTPSSNAVGSSARMFVSLAASYNESTFQDFAAFVWNLDDIKTPAKKVGKFPNAHRTPQFGPINTVLNAERTQLAAMIVQRSILGSNSDTWAVGTVNLATGNVTETSLSPLQLAETTSVSGFGIPFNASIWKRHH